MSASMELRDADQTRRSLIERLHGYCISVTRPIAFIGVMGMLIVSGVTVVDVLLRWLANTGIIALNEIVAMTFAVAVAACIPAGLAAGVGVTIDVLEKGLSQRTASWFRSIGALLLLGIFALLTWRMGIYAASLNAQGRTTVILGVPLGPFIWMTTLLFGISTIVQLVAALNLIRSSLLQGSGQQRGSLDTALWIILGLYVALACALILFFDPISQWTQEHPVTTVILGFFLMSLLLLGLVPLAAAMALAGLVGAALLIGTNPSMSAFANEVAGFLTNYQIATLPLFLMMGSFAAVAGISDDVYRLAQAVLGRFRGGLAMATIGGCAGFSAVTGSSLATVATFGRVALPQMESRAYAPHFAAGCVAAGGTLGALIPPSGPLIIFALLTESSIGQLFVGALLPGLLAVALYLLTIVIVVRYNPSVAPPREKVAVQELYAAIRNCGAVALLFGAVIGGMYSGIFTATEAAAVGAFGAFLIALFRGKLRASQFWSVMSDTTASTALIYTIIFGIMIFSFFVGVSGVAERATGFVGSLNIPSISIIALILFFYILLGCVMDSFTIMIVTVPIVTPIILHLGYDMIWWGIINLVIVEVGLITPPFGLHLFMLKAMLPKVSLMRMYWGVLPFCAADLVKLILLISFPMIVMWLPSTMAR